MPIQCRLYLSLTLLLPLAEAAAANFCVGTGDELRSALNVASGNGEDDLIRVRAGNYNATMNAVAFAYSSGEANALVVEGGWQLGGGPGTCQARVDDPTLTTLDGSNVRRVLMVYGFAGAGDFTLRNFTVRNGVSSSGAGGLQVGGGAGYAGDVLVERLVVHSNTGTIGGGMDGGSDGGTFVLSNSLIRDNQCASAHCAAALTINDYGGSGLPRTTIIGNTVYGNVCTQAACTRPGMRIGGSAIAEIANNAFDGHSGPDLRLDSSSQLQSNHLPSFEGTPPTSNTGTVNFADPGFENPAADDFRLRADAALIDLGVSGLPLPALDLSGLPRLHGARYDIGAYESQARLFADGFETPP